MTQEYTIKIRNVYENKSREVRVNGQDPMTVHKDIYMKELKSDEAISSELKNGFTGVS